jgi:hypothetical protein
VARVSGALSDPRAGATAADSRAPSRGFAPSGAWSQATIVPPRSVTAAAQPITSSPGSVTGAEKAAAPGARRAAFSRPPAGQTTTAAPPGPAATSGAPPGSASSGCGSPIAPSAPTVAAVTRPRGIPSTQATTPAPPGPMATSALVAS